MKEYNIDLYAKNIEGLSDVTKYLVGEGFDIGCGTRRAHPDIKTVDRQPDKRYADADIVYDCKDLECFEPSSLDFIFSSHCLEDFDNIPKVFGDWFNRLKKGGVIVLLLPDMETKRENGNTRYPRIEDGGNPSHKTNVGPIWFRAMLEKSGLDYEILQINTVAQHTSSFDVVIKRAA